ncbi:hypothetical protein LCGC14_2878040 [marine sediment metagenome]|uniref:Uncharacterized protein n=1 Tax=marine sediment metagenome TaxID=412755 RepID=A0A0F9AS34_9ZZZZ
MDINKLVLSDERLEELKAEYEEILGETWSPYVFYLLDAVSLTTVKKVIREEIKECEKKWREITGERAGLSKEVWDNSLLDLPAILKALEEG